MYNSDIKRAWAYHDLTKHSPQSVRRNVHFLDWANQPLPFKIYRNLAPIALPLETPSTGIAALGAIGGQPVIRQGAVPALQDLVQMFYYSAGITKRRQYPGGEILFRAAACTGALYEIELHLVCGPLPDLGAGVYHFNPGDLALRRLREGDYRGVVAAATSWEAILARAPAMVISTGNYWRNAWKYQARTYRHFGWDNGTLHANVLAMAVALGLPARLLCGFVDADINRLLALETDREVALAVVALGDPGATSLPPPPPIEPLALETVPLSKREVDYPLMREIHLASSLTAPEEVLSWRERPWPVSSLPSPTGKLTPLEPLSEQQIPSDTIEEVVLRRGSTRRFSHAKITFAQLSTILDCATRAIPADFSPPVGRHLNDLYLIVHAVEGLPPGTYFYHLAQKSLECLKHGEFRGQAAFLALEQDLAGDAAVEVFFLADLHQWLARFGNRGYRAVQLEAGILGGKMYLAAYALRLGATGLTFYDDEVVQFFSPHAAEKSAIFLVALGHPAGKQR